MFGPLVLLPAIAIANGVAYATSFRDRLGAVIAATTGVIVVPVLLQVTGAVPPWYAFDGDTLRILPWMTDFPAAPTLVFLVVTNVVVLAACLLYVSRLRRDLADAQRALRVQAWQLAQIVSR
jgi:hypothetical protein